MASHAGDSCLSLVPVAKITCIGRAGSRSWHGSCSAASLRHLRLEATSDAVARIAANLFPEQHIFLLLLLVPDDLHLDNESLSIITLPWPP